MRAAYHLAAFVVASTKESLCDSRSLECRSWDAEREEDCIDRAAQANPGGSRWDNRVCDAHLCAPCSVRYHLGAAERSLDALETEAPQ